MKYALPASFVYLALPLVSFGAPQNLAEVVYWVADMVGLIVPVIIAFTFLYILYGLTRYWIAGGGNEESTAQGKWVMITGIIGLTVIVGMWGLISLVRNAIFF